MKFNFILIFIFISSCSANFTTLNHNKHYTSKGFAYIYNEYDVGQKIIKGKMDNSKMQISHQNLKTGTLIKISNPKNKKSLVFKNIKRIKYPDFYKILITEPVAQKLDLNKELPILEIIEIKNKSLLLKKENIFWGKKYHLMPVASVQISNISKNKNIKTKKTSNKIFIQIASFYSFNTAEF